MVGFVFKAIHLKSAERGVKSLLSLRSSLASLGLSLETLLLEELSLIQKSWVTFQASLFLNMSECFVMLEPLKLERQVVVSCLTCGLRTKLSSSARVSTCS